MTKVCGKCEQILPLTAFWRRRETQYESYCKSCHNDLSRRRKREKCAESLEYRDKIRLATRLYAHNLTSEGLLALLAKQNSLCAICGRAITLATLHIDHDHQTTEVRGLLCRKCNLGLGFLGDCREGVENALRYLCKPTNTVMLNTAETVTTGMVK